MMKINHANDIPKKKSIMHKSIFGQIKATVFPADGTLHRHGISKQTTQRYTCCLLIRVFIIIGKGLASLEARDLLYHVLSVQLTW